MPAAQEPNTDADSMRKLIDSFPLTVFWKDRSSVYQGCNELFARWAGVKSPGAIAGLSDLDLPWADGAERYRTEDEWVIRTGEPLHTYDETRTAPDGTTVFMRRIKVPLRDDRGRVVGVAGIGEVIDGKGGRSRDPSGSEERLRILTENAAEAVAVVQDGRLVLLKARGRAILGCTEAQALSLSAAELIHPADRRRIVRDYREMLRGERRQAQEERARLYTAIEQAAENVLITAADGTITYVNPAFERVTGYSREEAIGRNPRILKSGRHDEGFYESMWRTLTSGNVWRGHLVNRRKDGSTYSEEASISPVKDAEGRTVSFVAVKRDVTHAMELEERLRQAQKMEAVGRLAGGVAHDFNNILTTITGYADLLLTGLGEQDPRGAEVREILDAARRASGLTRQLLTFSRKQVTSQRLISLNSVIENLDSMLRPLIGEDIRLVYDLGPGLWPILADAGQIEQVILNLSVNARDAMPNGGTLTFRTRNLGFNTSRAGRPASRIESVVLTVRDTGTGMDREVKSHLFEPFFTTKKPGAGTGLGLATVYGIVDQSRGHIEVESEPRRGTEFRVYFPGKPGSMPVEESAIVPVELPRGRETILLVEDELAVRSLTRTLLSSWGYSVREAADPAEAVRVAEREGDSIDLLLTDVVMPDMRGSELARRVRGLCGRAAVLFMSGYPDDEGLGIGRPGPGVHFLPKPFTPESLARKVRETIDGS